MLRKTQTIKTKLTYTKYNKKWKLNKTQYGKHKLKLTKLLKSQKYLNKKT